MRRRCLWRLRAVRSAARPFASRLAPTGQRISNVGASLLAKRPAAAPHHSIGPAFGRTTALLPTSMPCYSRASFLSAKRIIGMSQYTAFSVELADKIAHVQISRPEKINSMNAAFWSEIVEIFQWIDDTDEVRVVVLSGSGKHFSSGIDLMLLAGVANELGKDVGRSARLLRRKILQLQASFNAVDTCRKPVLA